MYYDKVNNNVNDEVLWPRNILETVWKCHSEDMSNWQPQTPNT